MLVGVENEIIAGYFAVLSILQGSEKPLIKDAICGVARLAREI